ncbi:hypothetical protein [Sinisalibacter lacisalsi]|uniref:Uncharacterized protein n=1 Tax=Sinisalibacter lacisalsi TaxID=1526570 RepID=A0ABQ1QUQ4_9RHOB|nr:hypothetical protein [Sinisalibacter lacisalsi]GGD44742.1 hypothetical protein GCM10011358_30630 [Sinisalibacter lacisalsi]
MPALVTFAATSTAPTMGLLEDRVVALSRALLDLDKIATFRTDDTERYAEIDIAQRPSIHAACTERTPPWQKPCTD